MLYFNHDLLILIIKDNYYWSFILLEKKKLSFKIGYYKTKKLKYISDI